MLRPRHALCLLDRRTHEGPTAQHQGDVEAPSHGDVYPVSVSLLRVGATSELRLEMEQLKGDGWRVINVLG